MRKLLFAVALAAGGFAATAARAQAMIPNIGSVITMGAKFCPQGWLQANGQLVPIAEYLDLFYVIGTTYGGDGQNTFALPKLTGGTFAPARPPLTWCIATMGKTPMHMPPKHK